MAGTSECPIGLRAADGDALQLEGMVRAPIKVGSKAFSQALFVVRNLKDPVLLGLDFLTTARAVIDVSSHTFTLGSEDAREMVLLHENAQLDVGAIAAGQQTYLVRAAEDVVILPHHADHIRVELDPPAPPGDYEFTNRHLISEHDGSLQCNGVFDVLPASAPQQVPLRLCVIHGAEEKPLRITKGEVLSVALPPLYYTSDSTDGLHQSGRDQADDGAQAVGLRGAAAAGYRSRRAGPIPAQSAQRLRRR